MLQKPFRGVAKIMNTSADLMTGNIFSIGFIPFSAIGTHIRRIGKHHVNFSSKRIGRNTSKIGMMNLHAIIQTVELHVPLRHLGKILLNF